MPGHLRADGVVNIPVADIESKVKIIGRLGKPLGTVCKVTCEVVIGAKPGSKIIPCKFLTADGKPLGKSAIIAISVPASIDPPTFKTGDKLALLGYETGSCVGTPAAAREIEKAEASKLQWKFQPCST